jgi:hypothetical protein
MLPSIIGHNPCGRWSFLNRIFAPTRKVGAYAIVGFGSVPA